MATLRHAYIAFALFSVGCAASTAGHVDARSNTFARLTSADLTASSARMLDEAIAQLRPGFLRRNLNGEPPTVFVDGMMASSPNVLHDLTTEQVAEVRFLRAIDATQRHGPVHSGAIVEVTLRTR